MATHSSILAWKNPTARGFWWATVHGLQRVRPDSETKQEQQKGNGYLESYHDQVAFWCVILFL